MGYKAAVEAIKAEVDSTLGAGGAGYAVQHANAPGFTKPDNAVWINAWVRPAAGNTVCISAKNTYRISGILDLQVFGPIGTSEADVNDAVELAMKSFDYININVGDAEGTVVQFNLAPFPNVIGLVGGQYQVNVTAPWDADFQET